MKIIDIRIEVEDDSFEEAWTAAKRAADGISEDLYTPRYDRDPRDDDSWNNERFTVGVFDASNEATP